MFITVLGQKEASRRAMKMRRSLSFVLTLFLTLLDGKGTLGGEQIICMDGHSLTEAHYTVLQNSALVAPYMEEHKNFLHSKHSEKSDDWITREQTRTFAGWLQKRALNDGDIQNDLYSLSQLPSSNIMTFKGYQINGNTFYTIAQDKKSTNQNSGVRFDATTNTGKERKYIMVT